MMDTEELTDLLAQLGLVASSAANAASEAIEALGQSKDLPLDDAVKNAAVRDTRRRNDGTTLSTSH